MAARKSSKTSGGKKSPKQSGGKKSPTKRGSHFKKCAKQWRAKSKSWRASHSWRAFLKGGKGKCSVKKKK
jgi:hypothetical protein